MKIENIRISNFLSFDEDVKVAFNTLGNLVLVRGKNISVAESESSNGAGKSALLEAFYWCLTGKSIRGVNASRVIRKGKRLAKVGVKFKLGDKSYVVVRKYASSEKSVRLHIDFDGENQIKEFHDAKQGTDEIFRILGISPQLLSLACFYGRHLPTMSNMTPAARASLVETIVNSESWERARQYARHKKDEYKSKSESMESDIKRSKTEIDELDRSIRTTSKEMAEAGFNHDKFVKEQKSKASELHSELLTTSKELASIEQQHAEMLKAAENNILALRLAEEELKRIESEITSAHDDGVELLENELRRAVVNKPDAPELEKIDRLEPAVVSKAPEIESKILRHDATRTKLAQEIEAANSDNSICPSCKQPMQAEAKKEFIEGRKKELSENEEVTQQLVAELEEAEKAFANESQARKARVESLQREATAEYEERSEAFEKDVAELREKIASRKGNAESAKAEMEKHVEVCKEKVIALTDEKQRIDASVRKHAADISELRSIVEKIREAIANNSAETQSHTAAYEAKNATLHKMVEEKKANKEKLEADLEEVVSNADTIMQQASEAEYWEKGFKSIRYSLFNQALSVLQDNLVAICSQQGLDFDEIEVSSSRESSTGKTLNDVSIVVKRGMDEYSIDALSEGERQRFDMACFLAVHALIEGVSNFKLEVAVLDEPMSGVDYDGRHRIFELFNALSERRQVFVIDHDANFQDLFRDVITVVKDETSTAQIGNYVN